MGSHNIDIPTNGRNGFINVLDKISGIVNAVAVMTIQVNIRTTESKFIIVFSLTLLPVRKKHRTMLLLLELHDESRSKD